MATALQAVRGMNDVLPDEAPQWQRFEDAARRVFERYGYRALPILDANDRIVGVIPYRDVMNLKHKFWE